MNLRIFSQFVIGLLVLWSVSSFAEEKRRTVNLVPDQSFGGLIMNDEPDVCNFTLEFNGVCYSAGYVGKYGRKIEYVAPKGTVGRFYGYCSFEGTNVPVQATFVVGQKFPMLHFGDTPQVGLFYPPMVSREVPPEYWPKPLACRWKHNPLPDGGCPLDPEY